MINKILLPVDGSEPSHRAIAVAGELAIKLGAEIVVLHAQEHVATMKAAYEVESQGEAHQLVDGCVRTLKDLGASARGDVATSGYDRAARVILEVAEEEHADLVVMGSRGLSDFAGLVLGSVTHKVLHLAHCPVLVVR
jgi:nucleotide-binding universal stress UspA family protein